MTFSLTATPEPSNTPPRVKLEAVESDPDRPLQSCTFYRNGAPLRFAATIAGDTAIVYDYDAGFDVSLEYRADAVELTSIFEDFDETWSDLTNWGGPGGSPLNWSVAGGEATTSDENASMVRYATGPIVRVHGDDPAFSGSATSGEFSITVINDAFQTVAVLKFSITNQTIMLAADSVDSVTGVAPTTFDIVFSDTSVTASGTGWSLTVPYHTDYDMSGVQLDVFGSFTGTRTVTLGELTVSSQSDPATLEDVTDTDTTSLTGIAAAWLTNGAAPDLAVEVSVDGSSVDGVVFSPETRKQTQARASSVQLDIEGTSDVLTVVNGPRKLKTWPMVLIYLDAEALAKVDALTANSAVVSLRKPAALAYMNVPDGFYSASDIDGERLQEPWPNREEVGTVTLPLTPSRAPSFDVLWAWNYAALAQTGMTYDEAAMVFDTYSDLLVGPS